MKSKKIVSMMAAVLMMTSVSLPASASVKDTTYEFKFSWAQTVLEVTKNITGNRQIF
jgi:hypothetical protein